MLVWIPETMAKARAPTAVILDMFDVILSLAGAVGWRQSGQFGLITLIQTLTLAPLARVEAWPGSGYFDNENNPSKISLLSSGALSAWSRFLSGTPRLGPAPDLTACCPLAWLGVSGGVTCDHSRDITIIITSSPGDHWLSSL